VSTPEINLQLSNLLFYSLNDISSALNAVKKCLHQDPENKPCKKEFRVLKNASKSLTQLDNFVRGEQWSKIINVLIDDGLLEQIQKSHDQLKKDNTLKSNSPKRLLAQLKEWACQSYSNIKQFDLALPHCNVALELNPESIPSLLAKAEHLLSTESYDQAIQLLNKANESTGGSNQKIRQQLERAQRLLRQSKKRDYYKILGVPRSADTKTIRKAYRDLSKKYHPDKYRGNLDADAVSQKMAEINSAYEVLSNEGLRSFLALMFLIGINLGFCRITNEV
jgi:DnaJ homolog subfamily C member 3